MYKKAMVTSYDLWRSYSVLTVYELSALDRSEKVVYIKTYLQLVHLSLSQFYGHLVVIYLKMIYGAQQ